MHEFAATMFPARQPTAMHPAWQLIYKIYKIKLEIYGQHTARRLSEATLHPSAGRYAILATTASVA